jgi:TonB family protein
MFGAARSTPLTPSGPRPLPVFGSLLAHGAVLSLVALGPLPRAPQPRSLYEQVIQPHEHELVWYSFKEKLPEVSPPDEQDPRPPDAERKLADQTIVSNPKKGAPGTQMIWRPLPQIKPQPEVASPNILAFRLPLIPPPPPGPPRKVFVPPPKQPKPPEPAPALPEAPKIPVRAQVKANPVILASLTPILENRPKPRDFVPPAPRVERRAAVPALPEAPGVATTLRSGRVPLLAENMAAPLANKPQSRTFIPPAAAPRAAAAPSTLPDAPHIATQLASANGLGRNPAIHDASVEALANKPKARAFVPPSAPSGTGRITDGAAAGPPLLEAPALDVAGMPSANVNVAVIGLNPAGRLSGPLPETSREATFSAGPDANGGAGGGAASPGSALSVPGLLVRGGGPQSAAPPNPLLIARAAPTSRESLEAAIRAGHAMSANDPPPDPPSAEIHLAPPPDPQFNGRDVYTLAVQMPNITSYAGSWIMWFAERSPAGPRGGRGLRPPVPLHKVDPKYLAAAIADRVEGKVQLAGVIRANGRVDLLRVLKGVDPRLDRSAEEALLKWEFEPAERNGTPVEVDLVAEIPFLLAPQPKR